MQLVARKDKIIWNGPPLPLDRPLLQKLKEPESGLGSGWATWLRSRVEGQFPVLTGYSVKWARVQDGSVRLGLAGAGGSSRELAADHVIAGTGYRTDLTRLPFFGDQMLACLRTVPGTGSSAVGRDYQSSIPGLYVMGPAVAPTMGPVMRFVFGSEHAATTVARQLTGGAVSRPRPAVTAGR